MNEIQCVCVEIEYKSKQIYLMVFYVLFSFELLLK